MSLLRQKNHVNYLILAGKSGINYAVILSINGESVMKIIVAIALVFMLIPFVEAFSSECSEKLDSVLREMEDAKKIEKEAEAHLATARSFRSRRSATTLPVASTPELQEWRSNLQYETSYYSLAARKYQEATKVYSDPGKKNWYRRNQVRRTWFDSDLTELLQDRQCLRENTQYKGRPVSFHYAAQMIARETDLQLEQWGRKIRNLNAWANIDEAHEINRLDPEKYSWCSEVVHGMAHPQLLRDFCGKIDGIGYQRLMPFVGCKSNLSYFGFENRRSTAYVNYQVGNGMTTQFFKICSDEKYLNEMTRNENFRNCMQNQAQILQTAESAASRCYEELNIATHGSAPRSTPASAIPDHAGQSIDGEGSSR